MGRIINPVLQHKRNNYSWPNWSDRCERQWGKMSKCCIHEISLIYILIKTIILYMERFITISYIPLNIFVSKGHTSESCSPIVFWVVMALLSWLGEKLLIKQTFKYKFFVGNLLERWAIVHIFFNNRIHCFDRFFWLVMILT